MTEGALAVIGGIATAVGIVAQVADYVMTVKGLDRGMKEVGLINSKVIAKWGEKSLPLATFLECVAVLGITAGLFTAGIAYGTMFAIVFTATEIVNDVRSARLLKII